MACGHTQIRVGVVTYIGAYCLLGAYYLSTYCYKCMRLLTRVYSIICTEFLEEIQSFLHTYMYVHIRSVPGSVARDPVSSRPSESERLSHRLIGPPSQSMYIMADLRKMDR